MRINNKLQGMRHYISHVVRIWCTYFLFLFSARSLESLVPMILTATGSRTTLPCILSLCSTWDGHSFCKCSTTPLMKLHFIGQWGEALWWRYCLIFSFNILPEVMNYFFVGEGYLLLYWAVLQFLPVSPTKSDSNIDDYVHSVCFHTPKHVMRSCRCFVSWGLLRIGLCEC